MKEALNKGNKDDDWGNDWSAESSEISSFLFRPVREQW